ncbi:MAG: FAD-binding protein [Flavobacteriia bacterium]|jgi:decaprenylphospho-beta-D-ribofuranose 2-oxidase
MEKISNWGKFPIVNAEQTSLIDYKKISEYVKHTENFIPRGAGKSYGDCSLSKNIFSTLNLNKIVNLQLDKKTITCESGTLLSEILDKIVPHKLFLPVVPGTKHITLGGAIAANIHGKNHHKDGAFGQFVDSVELMNESGEIVFCSREVNTELFSSTIGGMGLTGIILKATIQLISIKSSFIDELSIKAKNIDELITLFDNHKNYHYSVAWIDCLSKGENLGRSILKLGEHSFTDDKKVQVHKSQNRKLLVIPSIFPSFLLNSFTIKCFNFLYFNKQTKKEKSKTIHYDSYFFPLDKIKNWNNIYGKKGFMQYQFVIPFENGKIALKEILSKISGSQTASFLAVLKTFGPKEIHSSKLSFPEKGYTLALDFKYNSKNLVLLDELDKILLKFGGKIYLAKDARMSKETFQKSYTQVVEHSNKFSSLQSERLGI